MMVEEDGGYRRAPRRPNWSDAATYPDPAKWSYRRWAWEFLRRNKDYVAATKKGRVRLPKEKALVAQKFGRSDFKPYYEEYLDDDAGHHWLPEAILKKTVWYEEGAKDGDVTGLSIGEVALVFDLSQTLKGGTTAITSLLAHARKILLGEFEHYEETFAKGGGPKMFKPRRSSLFPLLRLHDAIVHAAAQEEEVVRVLYRSFFIEKNNPSEAEILKAGDQMKRDFTRAKKLVDGGYLTLVPLDSIQERTSTKRSKSTIPSIIGAK